MSASRFARASSTTRIDCRAASIDPPFYPSLRRPPGLTPHQCHAERRRQRRQQFPCLLEVQPVQAGLDPVQPALELQRRHLLSHQLELLARREPSVLQQGVEFGEDAGDGCRRGLLRDARRRVRLDFSRSSPSPTGTPPRASCSAARRARPVSRARPAAGRPPARAPPRRRRSPTACRPRPSGCGPGGGRTRSRRARMASVIVVAPVGVLPHEPAEEPDEQVLFAVQTCQRRLTSTPGAPRSDAQGRSAGGLVTREPLTPPSPTGRAPPGGARHRSASTRSRSSPR